MYRRLEKSSLKLTLRNSLMHSNQVGYIIATLYLQDFPNDQHHRHLQLVQNAAARILTGHCFTRNLPALPQ